MDNKVNKVFQEYERLFAEKQPMLNLWQEIGEFCYPSMSNFTRYITLNTTSQRARPTYDQTAEHALDLFASSMMSYLCNPATKWISFAVEDPELSNNSAVQAFTDEAQEKVMAIFNNPRNKFYDNIFTALKTVGAFGVAPMFVDEDEATTAKFKTESPKAYDFTEDFAGNVKNHYIMREYTADVLLEKAEKEEWQISEKVRNAKPSDKFKVLRYIYLNDNYDPTKAGIKFAKYISCYYLFDEKILLKEAFFNEAPLGVARWDRINEEKWSDSPARVALSDIKMLNATQKSTVVSVERTARPPLTISSDAKLSKIDFSPDAVNVARGNIRDVIGQLPVGGNPQMLIEWQQLIRQSIRTAFYIDIFQTAEQLDITATEANIRQQEKLKNISPKIARLQSDLIGPIAERVLYLLIKQGKIKVPDILANKEIRVVYMSPIASAYRAGEATSILQYLQDVGLLAQLEMQLTGQSSVADKLDFDVLAEELADIRGIKQKAMKPEDKVKKIRDEKAQQAKVQNTLATATDMSNIVKNLPQPQTA